MQTIPTQPTPNQILTVILGDQICQIKITQQITGIFCDLYLNGVLVVGGVLCQNLNRIVRSTYLGFVGDLCFIDNQGEDDPIYTGLGTRFTLVYLEPGEVL